MIKKKLLPSLLIILLFAFIFSSVKPVYASLDLSIDSLPDTIDAFAADYISEHSPGAAVVVFSQDEIIFSKGYGLADIEKALPMTSDQTILEYGSVSKLFVYTTIMQLVEKELVDLNTDIRQYLPDDISQKLHYKKPITLLNIMNHQAGFEDILTDIVITNPTQMTAFSDLLFSLQPEQVYTPGTITAYSNYAVALAAYIVQEIIDQPFYDHLQESIFQPLKMRSTTIHPDIFRYPENNDIRAQGYVYQPTTGNYQEIGLSYIPLYPVGAARGTAEDLARFAMALMPPENNSEIMLYVAITFIASPHHRRNL